MTTPHDFGGVLGRPLDTLVGSHNFMVTALGSCVKWPLRVGDLLATSAARAETKYGPPSINDRLWSKIFLTFIVS